MMQLIRRARAARSHFATTSQAEMAAFYAEDFTTWRDATNFLRRSSR